MVSNFNGSMNKSLRVKHKYIAHNVYDNNICRELSCPLLLIHMTSSNGIL